jgi:hypothetical protein
VACDRAGDPGRRRHRPALALHRLSVGRLPHVSVALVRLHRDPRPSGGAGRRLLLELQHPLPGDPRAGELPADSADRGGEGDLDPWRPGARRGGCGHRGAAPSSRSGRPWPHSARCFCCPPW